MGVNKIDSFMKNMALEAELDVEGKSFTNHSERKTLVKKRKASNRPYPMTNTFFPKLNFAQFVNQ